MPENQNFVGDRWTLQSIELLTRLGWIQIGTANFDIPCTNHTDRNGQGHGVDSIFQFYDPYFGKTINVLVESKTRQWDSMAPAQLKKFIKQVMGTMECACNSDQFRDLGASDITTGLLLCWCNDRNFDNEAHLQRLQNVGFNNKIIPYSIYLASNKELLRWHSVAAEMNNLRNQGWDVKYFYPSINKGEGSDAYKGNQLTLIHMFSKYIFAQSTRTETVRNMTQPVNTSIVFSFDAVSVNSLKLLYDICRQYQMQTADELIIYLYEDELNARVSTDHFQRFLEEEERKTVEFRYLNRLDGVNEFPNIQQ